MDFSLKFCRDFFEKNQDRSCILEYLSEIMRFDRNYSCYIWVHSYSVKGSKRFFLITESNFTLQKMFDFNAFYYRQMCDQEFDCPDLSDECFCENNKLPEICQHLHFGYRRNKSSNVLPCLTKSSWNQFKRNINASIINSKIQWISISDFCNGLKDCANGVDEAYCQSEMNRNSPKNNQISSNSGTMKCFRFQTDNPWTPRLARACDGNPECFSMEDECDMNCTLRPNFCQYRSFTGSFKCPENHILPGRVICDGTIDCDQTGDDEKICPNRFYCGSGNIKNIESSKVCDFTSDCMEANDELNCSNSHFYCKSKKPLYIRRYKVRDGVIDCSDGSDECSSDFFTNTIFSSEDFMIKHNCLQGMVWVMALFAILGNCITCVKTVFVLKHVMIKQKQLTKIAIAYNLLILNLAVADFLMGIFLLCIGIQNVKTKGSYCYHDRSWRSGTQCEVLGVISFLSSEVSIVTLAFLATYRLYCVLKPIQCRNLKIRFVLLSIVIAWVMAFIISFLPLSNFLQNYFLSHVWIKSNPYFTNDVVSKESLFSFCKTLLVYKLPAHPDVSKSYYCGRWENLIKSLEKVKLLEKVNGTFGYYSAHSTCLPKIFVTTQDLSWEFSIGVTAFNFCVCIYISCVYTFLVKKRSKLGRVSTSANRQTVNFQKRIALLIGTNFVCWVPVCVIAFLRFVGFSISDSVYSFAAIILLPINSAVNPFFSNNLQNFYKFFLKLFRNTKQPASDSNELGSSQAAGKKSNKQNSSSKIISAQKGQKFNRYSKAETENSFLIVSMETQV